MYIIIATTHQHTTFNSDVDERASAQVWWTTLVSGPTPQPQSHRHTPYAKRRACAHVEQKCVRRASLTLHIRIRSDETTKTVLLLYFLVDEI